MQSGCATFENHFSSKRVIRPGGLRRERCREQRSSPPIFQHRIGDDKRISQHLSKFLHAAGDLAVASEPPLDCATSIGSIHRLKLTGLPCLVNPRLQRAIKAQKDAPTLCLNVNWFLSLEDARGKIEAWRRHYNESRPHSALEDVPPSEFASKGGASPALAGSARPGIFTP
jgi:hypothetical protein